MLNNSKNLMGLRSGHGLTAREVIFADSRTILRACNEPAGFNMISHNAPDSQYELSINVLRSENGLVMTWDIDGLPHLFEWVESYPFGCVNCENRPADVLKSRVVVEEGVIQWLFAGVQKKAIFTIPRAMFIEMDKRDKLGDALEVSNWNFTGDIESWSAIRDEKWLFRDSSTYSGIAGRSISPEQRSSKLYLVIRANNEMSVDSSEDLFRFQLIPDEKGQVTLAIGIASDMETADKKATQAMNEPEEIWQRQVARYKAIAEDLPDINFGRHNSLKRFAQQQPLYIESMRITDTPGASRAKNEYGGVWGWDMTRPAFGVLLSGRHDCIRNLLNFRVSPLNSDGSLINQYDNSLTRDLRVSGSEGGVDGLEYMLAHDYIAWSGDDSILSGLRDWLIESAKRIIDTADPITGMFSAPAASTDFPEEFGRTWPGWLAYSTSWHYGGLRAAEKLLQLIDEFELANGIGAVAERIRVNFARIFWNESVGFWNEGVNPKDPDLICDIPLSTAIAGMDSPYGEDLYGERLSVSAKFTSENFLREDGIWITARGEKRGWKEWTRQGQNWYAGNDTQVAKLLRATGDIRSLERLFYMYELNFGHSPFVFEGKPLLRPLNGSCSWYAMGCGAWYRNLIECAAGLSADLGGLVLTPGGLSEPICIKGLSYRGGTINFTSHGHGLWPRQLLVDGQPLVGSTKLPPLSVGVHHIEVTYGIGTPIHPVLTQAVNAEVRATVVGSVLHATLYGTGYTPISFFAPDTPVVTLDGQLLLVEWDAATGRGRTRCMLEKTSELVIECRCINLNSSSLPASPTAL